MAKPSRVHRPTEDAAIGGTQSRPQPMASLERLWELLAAAVRRHDRHGAQLLRNLLARTMTAGVVGAP